MDRRHTKACRERSKLIQLAIEIWICTDDERVNLQFSQLGKGRVNISTSPCLKNGSFDPKQRLSVSRLSDLFGIVWIAGVHQHRDQCSARCDRMDKIDLFSNETFRRADNARNIAARLLDNVDKAYFDRVGP